MDAGEVGAPKQVGEEPREFRLFVRGRWAQWRRSALAAICRQSNI